MLQLPRPSARLLEDLVGLRISLDMVVKRNVSSLLSIQSLVSGLQPVTAVTELFWLKFIKV